MNLMVCVSPGMMSDSEEVRTLDGETVRRIPILFEVGYVEIDRIADKNTFNVIRSEVETKWSHINMDVFPLRSTRDSFSLFATYGC